MIHNFDTDIAQKYGILEAILLNNIYYWIEKNRANETNFYDGTYWTYNSTKAFSKLFSYATERQIRNALKHLVEEKVLATGNYNKSSYDRTLWYALTEKGRCIVQKCQMDSTEMSNGSDENGQMDNAEMSNGSDQKVKSNRQKSQMDLTTEENPLGKNVEPIPDIKPYIKPDNKTDKKDFSSELENPAPEPEQEIQVITLPLNTGEEYPITEKDVELWKTLYPAVDILQELRTMKGWVLSHPKRKKTKRGVMRFINGWLAREQDRGNRFRGVQNTYQGNTGLVHQEQVRKLIQEENTAAISNNKPEVRY